MTYTPATADPKRAENALLHPDTPGTRARGFRIPDAE
jgi:hypothetical protein